MKNKNLQKGNILIAIILVILVILVAIFMLGVLKIGPFKAEIPPASEISTQKSTINDSDDLKDIENDLNDANVLGADTELETIMSELNTF